MKRRYQIRDQDFGLAIYEADFCRSSFPATMIGMGCFVLQVHLLSLILCLRTATSQNLGRVAGRTPSAFSRPGQ